MSDSIRAQGIVRKSTNQGLQVSFVRSAGCGTCAIVATCGSRILTAFSHSEHIASIAADSGVAPGAEIEVAISGRRLLTLTGAAYLLPAVLVLLGAGLAVAVAPGLSDAAALTGAAVGLFAGILVLRAGESLHWSPQRIAYVKRHGPKIGGPDPV